VELRSLLAAVKGMQPGSIVPYTAQIDLGVDAPMLGRINLPVSHSGELPVPAIPEVALVAFDIDALSLDKVAASARLRIRNTNQFELALHKLGLNLALGGKDVAQSAVASNARLAPGQSATLDVPVTFSPRALGGGVFNLLTGSEAAYALSGSLDAGTGFGPLTLPIRASGRTPVAR
jgi:LEA14-like dessication related protein